MSPFESLEAQLIAAQRTVDVLGLSEWGSALQLGILTRSRLSVQPKARTDRRELVAMPQSWLAELAQYANASPMGLDYLARYALRHGFVSIHAASRWLDMERQIRALRGRCEPLEPGPGAKPLTPSPSVSATTASEPAGLTLVMNRANVERAASRQSLRGLLAQVVRRANFELTEAFDTWHRAERRK